MICVPKRVYVCRLFQQKTTHTVTITRYLKILHLHLSTIKIFALDTDRIVVDMQFCKTMMFRDRHEKFLTTNLCNDKFL